MAGYVSFVVLGFLLLVLPPAFGVEVQNLRNIINHLHDTYGLDNQYSLGISVPVGFCNQIGPLNQNFLSQDDENKVKKDMSSKDRVYIGTQLIGARPQFPRHTTGTKETTHAEYLLLRSTDPSHMKDLLNKGGGGCTVFFSLNSPCVEKCSTPTGPVSILPGLEIFRNYIGPKAFVFHKVYSPDSSTDWERNLLEVDKLIPVYLCNNECVRCVTSNNRVDSRCTAK